EPAVLLLRHEVGAVGDQAAVRPEDVEDRALGLVVRVEAARELTRRQGDELLQRRDVGGARAPDRDHARPVYRTFAAGKCGFSMTPIALPKGPFTVATRIPPPTSCGGAPAEAPSSSSRA